MKHIWNLYQEKDFEYFHLNFNERSFKNLQLIFTTKKSGQDLLSIESKLNIGKINFLFQTHSDNIIYIPDNNFLQNRVEGDGLFTDQKNVYLGVKIADCLPIYFCSYDARIIGIVHSGWKGTLKTIGCKMAKTIKKKYNLSYNQIYYAFGPSINKCCYEIKQDLVEIFQPLINKYNIKDAIINRGDKMYLDLKKTNETMLDNLGLIKIADLNMCTFCNKELFHSARRQSLTGRNYAVIGLKTQISTDGIY